MSAQKRAWWSGFNEREQKAQLSRPVPFERSVAHSIASSVKQMLKVKV